MEHVRRVGRIHPLWWTVTLFATIVALMLLCVAIFAGFFHNYIPVTLTSDRAGLVMESGSRVMLRGVEVGRVAGFSGGGRSVRLNLEIYPDQINYIPANVGAQILATTAFGAKYVDLIYPAHPSPKPLSAGAVLHSQNVATEVNTVFDNLVRLLNQIDVRKLSSVLTALADGVRGQGDRMGEAITDANQVLAQINPRMDTVDRDWRSFKGFSDAYSAAAQDILKTLDASSTTGKTITDNAKTLDALLLSTTGFANAGTDLLAPNQANFIEGINSLEPTTNLLLKYSPSFTCLFTGAKWALDHGLYQNFGGNGRGAIQDVAVLLGDDPYRNPDNLPIVAAKGGPGGQPGCGSLPDASKKFPVPYLVTNTGFGTGLDVRPNPGIGFPGWANYFPVTKAIPEPPKIRYEGGPAPGPAPAYPGGAPYGAPLYGPGGVPLWPGVPPAPGPLPGPAPAAPDPASPTGPLPDQAAPAPVPGPVAPPDVLSAP
ncbi:MCE family protein [Mycobacterium sherrisii]|uniref:MCE family protein n=1 Tax=Mycobacterium sherrisii TaxID=243061 RepID=UPI000A156B14|nr:MCE family protein [Mycobacterium sherrisii]MCV7032502.1 MCE family protein [Mycobacterium sherrisii]ORW74166.1 MCE-family protein MCE3A [Mycobacterium sherrisii]